MIKWSIMQILFKNVRMTWLQVSSFHNLGKSALAFHSLRAAQIAQKNNGNSNSSNNNDYNNNNQEQISEEEEYLTDHQYEQERFTDALSALVDISPIIPIVTNTEKTKAIIDGITSMTNFPEFIS
jgi:hypothetical protein